MNLFLEKGRLSTELADALEHFEKRAATLGMHPDELVGQFHHSNMATEAVAKAQMRIFNSRRRYLAEREYEDKPPVLSVIR